MPFNARKVEVAPALPCQEGDCLVCDTHSSGRCKLVHPDVDIAALDGTDTGLNGNVRKLIRTLKQWQRHSSLPIESLQIEAPVMEVLPRLIYGGCDESRLD